MATQWWPVSRPVPMASTGTSTSSLVTTGVTSTASTVSLSHLLPLGVAATIISLVSLRLLSVINTWGSWTLMTKSVLKEEEKKKRERKKKKNFKKERICYFNDNNIVESALEKWRLFKSTSTFLPFFFFFFTSTPCLSSSLLPSWSSSFIIFWLSSYTRRSFSVESACVFNCSLSFVVSIGESISLQLFYIVSLTSGSSLIPDDNNAKKKVESVNTETV